MHFIRFTEELVLEELFRCRENWKKSWCNTDYRVTVFSCTNYTFISGTLGGGKNLLKRDRRNKKFSSWRTVHLRVQRVQGDFRSASANIDTVDMQAHTRVCTPFWPRVSPRDWSPIRAASRILMWENTIPTRWMPSCVRCWLFQDVVY